MKRERPQTDDFVIRKISGCERNTSLLQEITKKN